MPIPIHRKAFTMVEIMIAIAIVLLLARIVIPNIIRAKVQANESTARSTLKSMATATETYALVTGNYPLGISDLVTATPPYLNTSYCNSTLGGYFYSCTFGNTGYTIEARPIGDSTTGTLTFTLVTGGIVTP